MLSSSGRVKHALNRPCGGPKLPPSYHGARQPPLSAGFFGDDDYLACVEMLMEWREIQGGFFQAG